MTDAPAQTGDHRPWPPPGSGRHTLRIGAVILAACWPTAGCGNGPGTDPAAQPETVSSSPDRRGSAGITVRLPAGWSTGPIVPTSVSDPVERIVVSSVPARPNERSADCMTEASTRAFDQRGVLVVVMEYRTMIAPAAAAWPPRPERFDALVPARVGGRSAGGLECHRGPYWSFAFADHGRRLLAWVVVGETARPSEEAAALDVLNTLQVASDSGSRVTSGP